MSIKKIRSEMAKVKDPERAEIHQRFFKTGPGEYGEGDIFMGIKVPELRRLAKQFKETSIKDSLVLLQSPIHEERLLALFIFIHIYRKGDSGIKEEVYDLYLANTAFINNWDLVDSSAEHIVGTYLMDRDKGILQKLLKSESLWERRISIMATFHLIKKNNFSSTIDIAEKLLSDKEDLIHKAVGWMLREIGKRDMAVEETFLKKHYKKMPRTMLRYAIEKFPEPRRQEYLKGKV